MVADFRIEQGYSDSSMKNAVHHVGYGDRDRRDRYDDRDYDRDRRSDRRYV